MTKKVFVSGCFDMLHSGHVAFLKTAASSGDLYVGVARDETIKLLKGKAPGDSQAERLFMVRSVRWVKDAWLSGGVGMLDFAEDLERLRPNIFIVNEDGHTSEKAALCARLGIDYRVLRRMPEPGLPARSTSALRAPGVPRSDMLPYRAEICGAWLDQLFVNRVQPGWVICAQLAPHSAFAQKSGGLATSTRACLAQLKAASLPHMEPEALARLVFRVENGIDQPDHPVSGAQDALGLCVPGVSFQYYDNGYWPRQVDSTTRAQTLRWLEDHLSLYPLPPRPPGFEPLLGHGLQDIGALASLAQASALCKSAVKTRNPDDLSESLAMCRRAQKALFPAMYPPHILLEIERLESRGHFRSWKFTGAGGGGWVLLVDAQGLPGAIPLRISGEEENANEAC